MDALLLSLCETAAALTHAADPYATTALEPLSAALTGFIEHTLLGAPTLLPPFLALLAALLRDAGARPPALSGLLLSPLQAAVAIGAAFPSLAFVLDELLAVSAAADAAAAATAAAAVTDACLRLLPPRHPAQVPLANARRRLTSPATAAASATAYASASSSSSSSSSSRAAAAAAVAAAPYSVTALPRALPPSSARAAIARAVELRRSEQKSARWAASLRPSESQTTLARGDGGGSALATAPAAAAGGAWLSECIERADALQSHPPLPPHVWAAVWAATPFPLAEADIASETTPATAVDALTVDDCDYYAANRTHAVTVSQLLGPEPPLHLQHHTQHQTQSQSQPQSAASCCRFCGQSARGGPLSGPAAVPIAHPLLSPYTAAAHAHGVLQTAQTALAAAAARLAPSAALAALGGGRGDALAWEIRRRVATADLWASHGDASSRDHSCCERAARALALARAEAQSGLAAARAGYASSPAASGAAAAATSTEASFTPAFFSDRPESAPAPVLVPGPVDSADHTLHSAQQQQQYVDCAGPDVPRPQPSVGAHCVVTPHCAPALAATVSAGALAGSEPWLRRGPANTANSSAKLNTVRGLTPRDITPAPVPMGAGSAAAASPTASASAHEAVLAAVAAADAALAAVAAADAALAAA